MNTYLCQITAISNLVTKQSTGLDLGELRMIADAFRSAERAVEDEIARRVKVGSFVARPAAEYWEDMR